MEIERSYRGEIQLLQLKGRFDAHEVGPVTVWFKDQLEHGNNRLVVNQEGVNFIDSTALSTLVSGLKHCREQGGDLHLSCLLQPVRVIFELTRLDKAFAIFARESEAVAAFSPAVPA